MPSRTSAPPPAGVFASCADAALKPRVVWPPLRPPSPSGTRITIVPVVGLYELFGSAGFVVPLWAKRPSVPPLTFVAATYDWKVGTDGFVGSNHMRTPRRVPLGALTTRTSRSLAAAG